MSRPPEAVSVESTAAGATPGTPDEFKLFAGAAGTFYAALNAGCIGGILALGCVVVQYSYNSYRDPERKREAFRTLLDSPAGWPASANRVQAHLSPRLGVSFPITESSKLYFNYGHFYQRPPISFMYNTQLSLGAVALPTPDLDMARTVSYELGYEQMLLEEVLVGVTAYYKNVTGEPLSRRFINYYGDNIVAKYFPDAYRDIRGVELRLERPVGRFVTFTAMYDYMVQSAGKSGLAQVFENRLDAVNELRSANIEIDVTKPGELPPLDAAMKRVPGA